MYSLTTFICLGDNTSPPVSKYFILLNILGFASHSLLNKGDVSHKIVILLSSMYCFNTTGFNKSSFFIINKGIPFNSAAQISNVQASNTIEPV